MQLNTGEELDQFVKSLGYPMGLSQITPDGLRLVLDLARPGRDTNWRERPIILEVHSYGLDDRGRRYLAEGTHDAARECRRFLLTKHPIEVEVEEQHAGH